MRHGQLQEHRVILTEHDPVYTMGQRAITADLLVPASGIPVIHTDRGGRMTYHGPGQLMVYLIWNLRRQARQVRAYVTRVEEMVRQALATCGVLVERDPAAPGLWVGHDKVAALGIRIQAGIAYHGVAINRAPDLAPFDGIIPCGLRERGVTSLERLGCHVTRAELEQAVLDAICDVFQVTLHATEERTLTETCP
jgi:lipoate-protein ligase B